MEVELSGEEEYDRLIAPVRKLCKFISIWPVDLRDVGGDVMKLERARKLQQYHKVFIFAYMSFLGVAQVADLLRNLTEMEKFTECFIAAASCLLTIFRLTIYTIHRKKVNIVLEKMRSDWMSASEEDREILRTKCRIGFFIARFFIFCVILTMSFFSAYPTLQVYFTESDEWQLPYGGYFYIDVTKTPTYHILYAVKVFGGIYGIANVAAVNSLNLISIIHVSANFLVLQSHLSSLKRDDRHSDERLRLAIQEHQRAIELADVLEEVINKMAFGQFIVSTGIVCFAGLQVTEILDNKIHLAMYAIYLASSIFELYLFSYGGYQLTLESESVGASAFNSDWVGSTFTQNLQIVMMRSTKPSTITAAKFYDMSLESFSMVLSTSFSYFTTLRAMNEE